MKKDTASELSFRLHQSGTIGNQALRTLKANENLDAITEYAGLLGKFMGLCYFNVFLPLWEAFPEIRPREMEGEYAPAARLSEESKSALRDFIIDGHRSIELIESAFPANHPDSLLKQEGIAEIRLALADFEAFLQRP